MIPRKKPNRAGGSNRMRMAQVVPSYAAFAVMLGVALGGCSLQMPKAGPEPALSAAKPADQLVGKNLDAIIEKLGQPHRSRQMDNNQSTFVWEIEPREAQHPTGDGGLYGDANNPSHVSAGYEAFCKITVVADMTSGNVLQASTEESNGTGAAYFGTNICSRLLRTRHLS
jgi:hypothetical protein